MIEIQEHFSNVHQSANIFERIQSFIFRTHIIEAINSTKTFKFLAKLPKVSKKAI